MSKRTKRRNGPDKRPKKATKYSRPKKWDKVLDELRADLRRTSLEIARKLHHDLGLDRPWILRG